MADRDKEGVFRPNEADKRLARYKKRIKKGLNKYSDNKQKFVSTMAQLVLAEVRNERKLMNDCADELRSIYEDFTPNEDE